MVSEGAGDADEGGVVPGGDDDSGLVEHCLDAGFVIHRAALGEGGAVQHVDKLFGEYCCICAVSNHEQLVFHAVVGGFLGDGDVVGVGFA